MLKYIKQDDYTLVTPGPDDEEWLTELMKYGRERNREFLDQLAEKPRGGRLSGSFIYSHPPDYIGRPTMHWGKHEWQSLLREMKELGIDTLIYQAAAWVEFEESSYPSKLLSHYKTWNSIEPLCQAVAAEGMTLYLGGLGNLMGFDEKATVEVMNKDRDAQLGVFQELVEQYKGGFHGFYMSPETGFQGSASRNVSNYSTVTLKMSARGSKISCPGFGC